MAESTQPTTTACNARVSLCVCRYLFVCLFPTGKQHRGNSLSSSSSSRAATAAVAETSASLAQARSSLNLKRRTNAQTNSLSSSKWGTGAYITGMRSYTVICISSSVVAEVEQPTNSRILSGPWFRIFVLSATPRARLQGKVRGNPPFPTKTQEAQSCKTH